MTNFASLGDNISKFLAAHNITTPTPIQSAVMTNISDGKSMLLLAPTGSGKTEAALLPLLHRLEIMKEQGIFGFNLLYITPLKALNRDVYKRIQNLCQHLGLTVDVRHGDTTQYARRKQALFPPNLLIITPETLQAILPGKRLKYNLKSVFAVIVDEIHELADSKRGVQLSLGLERLEKLVGTGFQRVGLSATVGNPKEVANLLGGTSREIDIVWAGYDSHKSELRVETVIPSNAEKSLAAKLSYPLYSTARLNAMVDLIQKHNTTLVFVNTRSFAEVLGSKMRLLNPPFEFDVHHGSLSKDVRLAAEDRLKKGVSKAIIATSSLELGIDIGQADLVIQYSSPREVSRALQRTGRAGHGVGQISRGVILATNNLDDITESGIILRRAKVNKVERASIPMMSWDVLTHQICGIILDWREINLSDLMSVIQASYVYSEITRDEILRLLDFMVDRRLVRIEKPLVKMGYKTRSFYYDNLSTIPDVRQIKAIDMATRAPIGVLDEDYVNEHVEVGNVFVIRGRPWHVISADEEEVMCSPASGTDSEAPRWIGEMIPVPYEVASEVADLLELISKSDEKEAKSTLKNRYSISDIAHEHILQTVKVSKDVLGVFSSSKQLVLEDFDEGLVIHSPFGTKTNETLGIIVGALLTTRLGIEVGIETDPYRILLVCDDYIDPVIVTETLREYKGVQISTLLRLAIRRTQTFASRFLHVGRRMSIIRKGVSSREIPVSRLITSFEETPVFDEAMKEVLDEKLDEQRVLDLFDGISEGKIEIHCVKTEKPSPLARLILEEKTRFEVMGEISDEAEILRMIEDRLLSKKFRLVCMTKGDWNSVRTISTLEDPITCPVCDSKRITAVRPGETGFQKIVKRKLAGRTLSKENEEKYRKADLIANLVLSYGRSALIVLAGRGIGAQTASRILRPGLTDRLELLKEIAAAEKVYARTRPFWD